MRFLLAVSCSKARFMIQVSISSLWGLSLFVALILFFMSIVVRCGLHWAELHIIRCNMSSSAIRCYETSACTGRPWFCFNCYLVGQYKHEMPCLWSTLCVSELLLLFICCWLKVMHQTWVTVCDTLLLRAMFSLKLNYGRSVHCKQQGEVHRSTRGTQGKNQKDMLSFLCMESQ